MQMLSRIFKQDSPLYFLTVSVVIILGPVVPKVTSIKGSHSVKVIWHHCPPQGHRRVSLLLKSHNRTSPLLWSEF